MEFSPSFRSGDYESNFKFGRGANSLRPHLTVCRLTHWGRVTHICVSILTIIGSDNGLSPGRRQTIIWTNAGILSIGPLGTNFNEISIGIQTFSFRKMHFKISSAKWRPFCVGLNGLRVLGYSVMPPVAIGPIDSELSPIPSRFPAHSTNQTYEMTCITLSNYYTNKMLRNIR